MDTVGYVNITVIEEVFSIDDVDKNGRMHSSQKCTCSDNCTHRNTAPFAKDSANFNKSTTRKEYFRLLTDSRPADRVSSHGKRERDDVPFDKPFARAYKASRGGEVRPQDSVPDTLSSNLGPDRCVHKDSRGKHTELSTSQAPLQKIATTTTSLCALNRPGNGCITPKEKEEPFLMKDVPQRDRDDSVDTWAKEAALLDDQLEKLHRRQQPFKGAFQKDTFAPSFSPVDQLSPRTARKLNFNIGDL